MLRTNKEAVILESKRLISSNIEKSIDSWSVWYSFGMLDAINSDFDNLKSIYPISDITIIDTNKKHDLQIDELIFNNEEPNLNFAVKVKIKLASHNLYNIQRTILLGSVALIVLISILSFLTYNYVKNEVFGPLHQVLENMDPTTNSLSLASNIKARGEMKDFVWKISKIYDQAKLSHRKKVILDTIETIAHDLRKPFSISLILCNHLLKQKSQDRLLETGIKILSDTLKRTDNMILELLDPQQPSEETCSTDTAIQKVVSQYEVTSDLEIKVDVDHAIIPMPEHKLVRVVENIIENAIQATDGKTSINITAKNSKNFIELSITNTGSFINSEKIKSMFNRGYSAVKNSSQRHGLGLAIVKKIVEDIRGTISCKSEKNKYTMFCISIPLGPGHKTV